MLKTFFNKLFIPERLSKTAEKKEVTIVSTYMGVLSTERQIA